MFNQLKDKVYLLMRERNITQNGLAAEIGITQSTLSRNLNGIHEPKADVIKKIADYFGVSVEYLLGTAETDQAESLGNIDIALYNATKELNENEKNEILDYINYIKSKNKT